MVWPPVDADHLLVDGARMKELENELFESGLPQPSLMEKVGLAIAQFLLASAESLQEGVLVLVGPGHNGGDGLVVARELHLAGVSVNIWCPLPIKRKLTLDHLNHLRWIGIEPLIETPDPTCTALWIDALFGLGQLRPLPNNISSLFCNRELLQPGNLISLDVPSGLCSDTGIALGGYAAKASLTFCIGLFKRGLLMDSALPWVGKLQRIDLGFPDFFLSEQCDRYPRLIISTDFNNLVSPQPVITAMKYQRGRVLVIAGSDKYRGAANLSLQGALASGCGSIQALVPQSVQESLWQQMPEVVLSDHSQDLDRLDAVIFGPGIGGDLKIWIEWKKRLKEFGGLLVLDADGLNAIADSKEDGWQWLLTRLGPTWLTPHEAEFRRLFPDIEGSDPLEQASFAATCSGCCILLKGTRSVIADPEGSVLVLEELAHHAARTGLGDLLAGYLAGWAAITLASNQPIGVEALAKAALFHSRASLLAPVSEASAIAKSLKRVTTARQKLKSKRWRKS